MRSVLSLKNIHPEGGKVKTYFRLGGNIGCGDKSSTASACIPGMTYHILIYEGSSQQDASSPEYHVEFLFVHRYRSCRVHAALNFVRGSTSADTTAVAVQAA